MRVKTDGHMMGFNDWSDECIVWINMSPLWSYKCGWVLSYRCTDDCKVGEACVDDIFAWIRSYHFCR